MILSRRAIRIILNVVRAVLRVFGKDDSRSRRAARRALRVVLRGIPYGCRLYRLWKLWEAAGWLRDLFL